MILKFSGFLTEVEDGILAIQQDLGFSQGDGFNVQVEKTGDGLSIDCTPDYAVIKYKEKVHFFRALAILVENLKQGNTTFSINEKPSFSTCGAMFDLSRNAVLTVNNIQKMLRKMALMGLDMMMLYTEDTYQIEGYPYFGYLRGAYTQKELKECDDYAYQLGIEMIPCIQTLAHLNEALKWRFADGFKDTDDTLLVGNEKTYAFITDMLKAMKAPFRSKRIHIGMDEAHQIGLGKYLSENGFRPRFEILSEHLTRVKEIASDLGFTPMMWSDMFFRLGSKTGSYYDQNAIVPKEVADNIPNEVDLVYWDYYHTEQKDYEAMIKRHKELGKTPIFAGAVWTFCGNSINYTQTFKSTNAALSACKKEGVQQVFATMWGDDGAETNLFTALLGLQLYAEHNYHNNPTKELLEQRFKASTGCDVDAFLSLELDRFEQKDISGSNPSNASKQMLLQDVLLGLFDKNIENFEFGKLYKNIGAEIKKYANTQGEFGFLFKVPALMCKVLEKKWDIGIKLQKAYKAKDAKTLSNLTLELSKIHRLLSELRLTHRDEWMHTNKPFGWDVLDLRYGGLMARVSTTIDRIKDYLDGKIQTIDELEEERLYFNGPQITDQKPLVRINSYNKIVSPCVLYHK